MNLLESHFLQLGFRPICLTTWGRRGLYLRVKSETPPIVEVFFGNPKRKLREVSSKEQLNDLYKAIYDESLIPE